MSSDEIDYSYEDVLDNVDDEGVKKAIKDEVAKLIISEINENQTDDKQLHTKRDLTRDKLLANLQFKSMPRVDEQQSQIYEDQPSKKRARQYKIVEPPKFKIIGYNHERKPIFKMTDLYLVNDLKVQTVIDEEFSKAIYGGKQVSYGFSSKFDNRSELQEIISKWKNKQQEGFQEGKNNLMSEEELQQTLVNLGDKKQNYFLYHNNYPQNLSNRTVKNIPLSHPNFKKNMYDAVNRLSQQYQQYNQIEVDKPQIKELKEPEQEKNQEKPIEKQYFGQIKDKAYREAKQNNNANDFIVDEASDKAKQGCLNDAIVKYFSMNNPCIIYEDAHKKSIQQYNRIQIDLNNPNFFLDKLNTVLQKNTENKKLKTISEKRNITDPNTSIKNPLDNNKSVISGSLITANRQISAKRSIGLDNIGQIGEDQNESIEQKINKELKSQQRDVINHSDVAKNCVMVKFSVKHRDFYPFHRYSFPYAIHFNCKVKINFVKHKPLKNKGTDLSLNSELIASYKKFNRPETLSLSNGEYILVQYVEENPLLISNVGMCERMLLQVNYPQILGKIKQDIFNQYDIEMIEQNRDNQKGHWQNATFQEKCELWRKNIRQSFGQNGKVFMWESKRQGKLIGNPQGNGVAIMDSNLGSVPIVRKQNKRTDFLLVRQGDKWFIRKIDNLYVSGQVQPKKTVLNPDSRQFYANFMASYQKAYILRAIAFTGKVRLQELKSIFTMSNENSIKKVLKSVGAQGNDGKTYTITTETKRDYQITPQDICLYQKMQSNICTLEDIGITRVRHTEKIRQILNIYFKRHLEDLKRFAVSKMLKEQLQLTSWYLTESFASFINGSAKIDLHGHADPTNGRGGYSFIKKPQKQRTQRQEIQQKQQKAKVSGTTSDLRKLKTQNTSNLLLQRGYKHEDIKGKTRWELVKFIKQQQGTEYARQQRQTKIMKLEQEKRQINKIFNKMLRILNQEQETPAYQYNYDKYIKLQRYMERQKSNWARKKQFFAYGQNQQQDKQEDIWQQDD